VPEAGALGLGDAGGVEKTGVGKFVSGSGTAVAVGAVAARVLDCVLRPGAGCSRTGDAPGEPGNRLGEGSGCG
jgi:hypothetical protein